MPGWCRSSLKHRWACKPKFGPAAAPRPLAVEPSNNFVLHQAHIIRSKGAGVAACTSTNAVAALTSSSVLQVQHQQNLQRLAQQQADGNASVSSAVLEVLLRQWGRLMQERIHAAQMLLPDVPLVAAARTPDELDSMQTGGEVAGINSAACACAAPLQPSSSATACAVQVLLRAAQLGIRLVTGSHPL